MYTRREFVKTAALLSGAAGMWSKLPESIARAAAIEPEAGSSFLDAEHVVILMQENRSFDHAFGSLRGVRGFNDPRAITLADGNPVWVQTNTAGQSFVPFRLNIKDSNATWLGSLPHTWSDQTDARNGGLYDRWLDVKRSGDKKFADMPLTLGYYTRDDIPFYYALADAFTICDQHFCSSLTGTTPNRLYLWTGTIRAEQTADSRAHVRNEEADHNAEVRWTTFAERLEDHGVSWKVYQNEISLPTGFTEEEDQWLANFGDNPLEYFTQFGVRFADSHGDELKRQVAQLTAEIAGLKSRESADGVTDKTAAEIREKTRALARAETECRRWGRENYEKLSKREKSLHAKAFAVNTGGPEYRALAKLTYQDGGKTRELQVPRGDLFHQFREDCRTGNLPTVSWLVAPEKFSDHPSAPWYGAWYISEALDILTQNPEVWKKTIFILTYDENDGYFDHVPPFVAPHPNRPETGFVSDGIDTSVEYVELAQDMKYKPRHEARESSIGLGYRVPMIIASPWSRGGCVCSQVFDHTSSLQFLEKFLSRKTGRLIQETNISAWRRTVCGDLTSAFQPAPTEKEATLPFLSRDEFVEEIHRAQFKDFPLGCDQLTAQDVEAIRKAPFSHPRLPRQELGVRRSCPLPYQLSVNGALDESRTKIELELAVGKDRFGDRAAGAPFVVYAMLGPRKTQVRNYTVAAGDRLTDAWRLADFESGRYHLRVYGPNGFYRELIGGLDDPALGIQFDDTATANASASPGGIVEIRVNDRGGSAPTNVEVVDNLYGLGPWQQTVPLGDRATFKIETEKSLGWYDISVRVTANASFLKRYAGRIETGAWGFSDPAMGGRT
jgi:phospholipase C